MKALLLALALIPTTALAQFDELNSIGVDPNPNPQPVYGIPVQPILPVPRDRGPWGTGYSVVTTTRSDRPNTLLGQDFSRDLVDSETVTKVVPNDALGNPIRGVDLW